MTRPLTRVLGLCGALALSLCWQAVVAQNLPVLKARVQDDARLLQPEEAASLELKLRRHEMATGQQFALRTVPSLDGVAIETLSLRVANETGLGRARYNDGLLVLVAAAEHQIRIEVGLGLEEAISNERAAGVISNVVAPAFREGRYARGIDAAFEQLIAYGERAQIFAEPVPSTTARSGSPWLVALALPGGASLLSLIAWRRRRRAASSRSTEPRAPAS